MKTLAVLSALASVAIAQSTSACKPYLAQLNQDQSLKACTDAVKAATSAFSTDGTAGTAAVSSALNNICSTSVTNACSSSNFKKLLPQLFTACGTEIQSNEDGARDTYDTLYALYPLLTSACGKDDSGRYCATQVPKTADGNVAGGLSLANVQKNLGSTSPNMDTIATSNLLFGFRNPDLDADSLCTTCTRNMYTTWSDFESDCPYGPGLSSSKPLQGQTDIYNAIQSKCPANFLSGSSVQAAGAAGKGILGGSNGAERTQAGAIGALLGGAAMTVLAMTL